MSSKTIVTLKRRAGHEKKRAAAYRNVELRRLQAAIAIAEADEGGNLLVAAISKEMLARDHCVDDLSEETGIPVSHLRAIGKMPGRVTGLKPDALYAIAKYIDLQPSHVFVLANVAEPKESSAVA